MQREGGSLNRHRAIQPPYSIFVHWLCWLDIAEWLRYLAAEPEVGRGTKCRLCDFTEDFVNHTYGRLKASLDGSGRFSPEWKRNLI